MRLHPIFLLLLLSGLPLMVFLIVCLFGQNASAEEISGAVKIVDGDTIVVSGQIVRLFGIDAAETGQRCVSSDHQIVRAGEFAIDRLDQLTQAGARCSGSERDNYGRLIATCKGLSGANINQTLVAEGLAWAFIKYSSLFEKEENIAKKHRLGIWNLACEKPWEFREKRWKVAEQKSPDGCPIKGNISLNGRIYHTPWSRHYPATRVDVSKGERWFCSEAEAMKAGFRLPIR